MRMVLAKYVVAGFSPRSLIVRERGLKPATTYLRQAVRRVLLSRSRPPFPPLAMDTTAASIRARQTLRFLADRHAGRLPGTQKTSGLGDSECLFEFQLPLIRRPSLRESAVPIRIDVTSISRRISDARVVMQESWNRSAASDKFFSEMAANEPARSCQQDRFAPVIQRIPLRRTKAFFVP